jgi:DNA-binding GntR family transcriptional regulator
MPSGKKISALSAQVAGLIIGYIQSREMAEGEHLPEQMLANALGVSRFPIRSALQLLAKNGLLKFRRDKGFYLKASTKALGLAAVNLPLSDLEAPYQRIVDDYLRGGLSEDFTATQMQRDYKLSRDRLLKIINRMVHEGWVYKRQGHGWAFAPMIASTEAHRQNYTFRMAIEPAALLDPGFQIDQFALSRIRSQQIMLLEGGIQKLSKLQLIQMGAAFHETLVACSRNSFFIDAVKRANQLRRLAEYRARVDRTKIPQYCKEHLAILDHLEGGDRNGAADLLRQHLNVVKENRTGDPSTDLSEDHDAFQETLI